MTKIEWENIKQFAIMKRITEQCIDEKKAYEYLILSEEQENACF